MGTLALVAALALAAWLVMALVGAALLVHLPHPVRDAVWPAAPLVGFVVMALGLSWAGLVVPVGRGVWLVLAAAVALGVWGLRRYGRPSLPPATWGLTLGTWLASTIPLAIAIGPLGLTTSLLTRVTANNDAFYYVSIIDWLQRHTILEVPEVTSTLAGDSVAFAPAVSQDAGQLRIGSELVHAGLNTLLTTTPQTSWYAWMALAAPLAVVAAVATLRLLGVGRVPAALSGLVVGTSTLFMFPLYNANAPAAMGAALAPLALTVSGLALRDRASAPPLWFAAVLCTGTTAIYTEILPFLAPPLVAFAIWQYRSRPATGLARVGRFGLLCLIFAPYVWLRALRSLIFLAGVPNTLGPSLWIYGPWQDSAKRVVGAGWPQLSAEVTNPFIRVLLEVGGMVLPLALLAGVVGALMWDSYGPSTRLLPCGCPPCWSGCMPAAATTPLTGGCSSRARCGFSWRVLAGLKGRAAGPQAARGRLGRIRWGDRPSDGGARLPRP